ncbi:hypothetical protein JT05_07685 [Desulfosporosinus sp. Tol-M]|nr:hypothetical protein JT05_07685 [Desulfosporosinus sp. Tol-M]
MFPDQKLLSGADQTLKQVAYKGRYNRIVRVGRGVGFFLHFQCYRLAYQLRDLDMQIGKFILFK